MAKWPKEDETLISRVIVNDRLVNIIILTRKETATILPTLYHGATILHHAEEGVRGMYRGGLYCVWATETLFCTSHMN